MQFSGKSLQEQTGVRIIVCRIGELKLCDPLFIPAHVPLLSPLKQGKTHIGFSPQFWRQLFDTLKRPLSIETTKFLWIMRPHFLPKSSVVTVKCSSALLQISNIQSLSKGGKDFQNRTQVWCCAAILHPGDHRLFYAA